MAAQPSRTRNRAVGAAGAIAANILLVAGLLSLAAPAPPHRPPASLVSIALNEPSPMPPPPQSADRAAGEAAPPSRGQSRAPSPPPIARPLLTPTPAEVALDPGDGQAAGLGPAAGAGAGGNGTGDGTGASGDGPGAGRVTPPRQVAGALTNADYRSARAPRGAAGTVTVSFRIRRDGAVDHCGVIALEGYAGFAALTCRLIEQRFRFRPAMDAAGAPIEWTIRTDYTWAPR